MLGNPWIYVYILARDLFKWLFLLFSPCVSLSLALTCAYYNNDKFFTMFFFFPSAMLLYSSFLLMLYCVSFCCACICMHIVRIYQFRILPARPSCLIIAHIIKWICFSTPHTYTTYLYRFAHIYPFKSPKVCHFLLPSSSAIFVSWIFF